MLKNGMYKAEHDEGMFDRYKIMMKVKETEKSYIFELVEFDSRYSATQIETLFAKSRRFVLAKKRGGHGMQAWSDHDFTFYPYQVGVPFYFERVKPEAKAPSEMSYSEFCEYLDGEGYDHFEVILAYDDFSVYRETSTGRYFYLEGGENDASDFFELELVATLRYDELHDLRIKDDTILSALFSCDVCGERALDDHIEYLWFAKKR